jgi:hypothetical protein
MTSRADELRAKAEAAKLKKAVAEAAKRGEKPLATDPAGDPVTRDDRERHLAPVDAAPHAKPIRSTVDLAPVRHASLKAWCGETAVMIGRSRVTTQDVFRALVERLLTDETLAGHVRDAIKNQ